MKPPKHGTLIMLLILAAIAAFCVGPEIVQYVALYPTAHQADDICADRGNTFYYTDNCREIRRLNRL